MFRRLFLGSLVAAVPAVLLSDMFAGLIGYSLPEVPGLDWVPPVLGTVLYAWFGRPFLAGAMDLCVRGLVPGGTKRNLAYVGPAVAFDDAVPEPLRLLLADAQTSGGLLLSTPEDRASALVERLVGEGMRAAIIGRIEPGGEGPILSVGA